MEKGRRGRKEERGTEKNIYSSIKKLIKVLIIVIKKRKLNYMQPSSALTGKPRSLLVIKT